MSDIDGRHERAPRDFMCDVLGCPAKRSNFFPVRVEDVDGTFHEYSMSVCEWHDQFMRAATQVAGMDERNRNDVNERRLDP